MQTTLETSLQVKPRDALQETFQVASEEVLPVHLQVNFRVTIAFGPRTASRNAVEFAVRLAPGTGSGTTFRTALGTVSGTVPTVVPGRSILTSSTAPNVPFYG